MGRRICPVSRGTTVGAAMLDGRLPMTATPLADSLPPPDHSPDRRRRLRMLGGFELIGPAGPAQIQPAAARLLALLAIRSGQLQRGQVASTLWLDTSDRQA